MQIMINLPQILKSRYNVDPQCVSLYTRLGVIWKIENRVEELRLENFLFCYIYWGNGLVGILADEM